MDKRPDDSYVAAHEANRDLGKTDKGRKLLSSDLGAVVLGTYEKAEKLRSENVRDSMTGVFNYHYLINELDNRTRNLNGEKFAVLWVDMDNLKAINDNRGHAAGSEVLIGIARLLENKIRPNEKGFVGRYGGDEFIIVIPGIINIESAKKRAEEVRQSISKTEFRAINDRVHETVSIGVGLWNGKETTKQFLGRVDEAMYEAKKRGKNLVVEAKENV